MTADAAATHGTLDVPGAVCAMWFALPGVRSKSNFRRDAAGDGPAKARWRALSSFEDEVALAARVARPAGWPLGDASSSVAARPWVVAYLHAETLLDTGNISKSVLDAVEGVLYHTDASVRAELSSTARTAGAGAALAAFAVVEPCSPAELAGVVAALAAAALAAGTDE
jgi:hypothetical protein